MYSSSAVAVDKGLGFDFSDIADVVKSAATVGLNVYNQQMTLKQTKALAATVPQGSYPVGGSPYVALPMNQAYQPMSTVPRPVMYQQPSMFTTTNVLLMGAAALGVFALFSKVAR